MQCSARLLEAPVRCVPAAGFASRPPRRRERRTKFDIRLSPPRARRWRRTRNRSYAHRREYVVSSRETGVGGDDFAGAFRQATANPPLKASPGSKVGASQGRKSPAHRADQSAPTPVALRAAPGGAAGSPCFAKLRNLSARRSGFAVRSCCFEPPRANSGRGSAPPSPSREWW